MERRDGLKGRHRYFSIGHGWGLKCHPSAIADPHCDHNARRLFGLFLWSRSGLLSGDLAQLLVEALFVVVRLKFAGGCFKLLNLSFLAMAYRLYLDEVGHDDLAHAHDDGYRYLSLSGVIMDQAYVRDVATPGPERRSLSARLILMPKRRCFFLGSSAANFHYV